MAKSSIHDVAKAAGVSIMTVSRAVRGVNGVSEATRLRVLEIAKTLNYVPNGNARALATTGSNMIGISLPTLFNDVFADVLLGMRRTFQQAGYDSVVDTTDYSSDGELQFIERILQWQPLAVILTGVDHDETVRARLPRANIATLELWDITDHPIDFCVGIDHREAGVALGRHLVEKGYRAPAFIGAPAGKDTRADKRVEGLVEAFRAAGGRTLRRISVSDDNAFISGYTGFEQIDRDRRPDVVLFLNDHMAFGGLMRAEQEGLRVPDDIGIVGFNELAITKVLPRRITTMSTPRRQIGLVGARNLLARLNGVTVPEKTILPCTLVPGQTTRAQ
ncbi:LacI family DNA-binding transcriptional regulator [Pontivivens insulae]|uniref:HTH-type transcriptional regulator GntR n=1 Tax=Pontivivens insulae TaxID=1639689 RepID=A0A2R8A6S0_9RHOB|nr:LacI family DNA-binding transcriptional regulator [Pontivivens insulae]RED18046.1 LacI family transcriptional regulator [Pontivivens insulae]SPF27943.1 HTH-type transcriptional regulator GntR [Pontivivens insulae]